MKVIITDALYKHSRALARYLKNRYPHAEIVGLTPEKPRLWVPYSKRFDRIHHMDIHQALKIIPYDLIIPVSSRSVAECMQVADIKAVLPDKSDFDIAVDKSQTLHLAQSLGIPVPRAIQWDSEEISFPCVIKGSLEAGKNLVRYPADRESLKRAYDELYQDPSQERHHPIIQEYVNGVGLGFFGFYQKGVLKRFYMHERLREYPLSGGASTAAKTTFHPKAYEYGKKILDHLNWNGPAMVEFKYNPIKEKLWLMEINPKFWGSTELGLASGVNFGELLVKAVQGENIISNLSSDSYQKLTMRWPLDGDLLSMIEEKNWKLMKEYWGNKYKTNLRTNGTFGNLYFSVQLFRNCFR